MKTNMTEMDLENLELVNGGDEDIIDNMKNNLNRRMKNGDTVAEFMWKSTKKTLSRLDDKVTEKLGELASKITTPVDTRPFLPIF